MASLPIALQKKSLAKYLEHAKGNEVGAGMNVVRDSSDTKETNMLLPVLDGQWWGRPHVWKQGKLHCSTAGQHQGNGLTHTMSSPPVSCFFFQHAARKHHF